MTTKTVPSIISRHDYISVDFGNNRRLTTSYSGAKAAGAVPTAVFTLWADAMEYKPTALQRLGLEKTADLRNGAIVQRFVDRIADIWPEWNVAPILPSIGDHVAINFGKRRGSETGTVTAIRGTMVTAMFPTQGLIRFAADQIER